VGFFADGEGKKVVELEDSVRKVSNGDGWCIAKFLKTLEGRKLLMGLSRRKWHAYLQESSSNLLPRNLRGRRMENLFILSIYDRLIPKGS